jgi:hypothetical protein
MKWANSQTPDEMNADSAYRPKTAEYATARRRNARHQEENEERRSALNDRFGAICEIAYRVTVPTRSHFCASFPALSPHRAARPHERIHDPARLSP